MASNSVGPAIEDYEEMPPAIAHTTASLKAAAAAAAAEQTASMEFHHYHHPGAIWEPAALDVISGRGASCNAHGGNKKFRALCFLRKPEFEAANHAAKRRIATEIVNATVASWGSRFLKKIKYGGKNNNNNAQQQQQQHQQGPYWEMTKEQAILKACQVMRDHKRPDRVALREEKAAAAASASASGDTATSTKKRNRSSTTTPLDNNNDDEYDDLPPIPAMPLVPIMENPYGVHDHDVLCGRGAYVNGHLGNQRLRTLAMERKAQFTDGNYTEKRTLATEIVMHIRNLDPPGRFMRRMTAAEAAAAAGGGEQQQQQQPLQLEDDNAEWTELSDERAIHKACQVMRDIQRPDRKHREERRKLRKLKKEGNLSLVEEEESHPESDAVDETKIETNHAAANRQQDANADSLAEKEEEEEITMLATESSASSTAAVAAVAEAVEAAAEAMDKALEAAAANNNGSTTNNNQSSSTSNKLGSVGGSDPDYLFSEV